MACAPKAAHHQLLACVMGAQIREPRSGNGHPGAVEITVLTMWSELTAI